MQSHRIRVFLLLMLTTGLGVIGPAAIPHESPDNSKANEDMARYVDRVREEFLGRMGNARAKLGREPHGGRGGKQGMVVLLWLLEHGVHSMQAGDPISLFTSMG